MGSSTYKRIYDVVKRIPKGRVATYGQIAKISQASGPRQTGYALHALPEGYHLPWHRVINSKGEISLPAGSESHEIQRTLLESEGVEFGKTGRVSLAKYQWVLKKNKES
jgi:methylated-DNA-protein-cysteine methyltransferase-like protein